MGAIAQQAQQRQLTTQQSPARQMQAVLQRSWQRIAAVMPREMNEQRLYQMFVSAINREPKLAECSVESVLSCFMRCTSLGLEPSNVNGLGMAYILPYGNRNYRTGQKEATLIIGYKGMLALARRSGELKSIHAQAVYEGDEFEYWEDEHGQHFKFRANRDAAHEAAKLTDVYVNVQLTNGGFVFEHMTRSEIDQIMRRSPSAAAKVSPWKTDYEAMALKTVIRRSFRYLPVSVEARTAVVSDESTPDYTDILRPVLPTDDAAEQPHEAADAADDTADPWKDTDAPTTDEAAPTSGEE